MIAAWFSTLPAIMQLLNAPTFTNAAIMQLLNDAQGVRTTAPP